MEKYDVAVIGGGLSGLITAIYLAKGGKKVVVLEKSSRLGGRAMTNVKNGASFNLGAHALYCGGEAYPTFQQLGLKLPGAKPKAKGEMIWKGKLLTMPTTPIAMLTSSFFTWSAKFELIKLLLGLPKLNLTEMQGISLREWAENKIADPKVRHFFYALCRTGTYACEPDHQLAGPVLKQVAIALKPGVMYLDGGWQTIVDQLQEQAKKLGVGFRSNAHVKGIEQNQSDLKVVFAEGDGLNAASVVSTLAPADTYRLIGETGSPTLKRWQDEARKVTGACLDICLKRLPVANRHFVMGIDQPMYYSNHSNVAKLSEGSSQVIHVMRYHEYGEHNPKADERMLEETMNLVQPGWQKEVVSKQFLPNITVVNDYLHLGKSDLKSGPVVPEISGLYVAGDWASHGEMLTDAAVASGIRAAKQILQETR
ncbi:NAD(P)/FAD-dependent oxidoreductase [Paenibacillus psychroresistens]|uniref:NAD(P)/FAD-dependent oxidoreductase n=1 Tax=Paenibacillus psychroresistens TaxID=1778678 RepID=A0A6B8RF09_9BACL|nr:NAD(P)/FAD-dependent oxidoreductase [Paenibacillus psychroresistens]QGQ94062.1 NAD(P)/FAD-dependent oxidoreductase [Paenibacillus psychroresistens]